MDVLNLLVNAFVIAAVGLLLVRGDRRTAAALEGIRGELGELRSEMRASFGEVNRRIDANSSRIDAQSSRIDELSSRIDAHIDRHAG